MNLFSNGYFQLHYEPVPDILAVNLPDMRSNGLSEARHCFAILLESVRNYYVQNLLLDSSNAVVEVADTEYNELIYQVSIDLNKTSLKKVARVVSRNQHLEVLATQVQGQVLKNPGTSYQIRNFTSKEQALAWLT